eukprot:SAG31_NODE_30671_length_377_cov_1.564748_1_plen_31_part_01
MGEELRDCVNLMAQGFPFGILTVREYSICCG